MLTIRLTGHSGFPEMLLVPPPFITTYDVKFTTWDPELILPDEQVLWVALCSSGALQVFLILFQNYLSPTQFKLINL